MKSFKGTPESEVSDFLNAFPKKKEAAEKFTSLAIGLNELMLNADPDGIDTVIRIIDCLRIGDTNEAV